MASTSSAAKPWVVVKYGGTSVATVETWGQILARVKLLLPTNRVWIVVSALSKVRGPRVVVRHPPRHRRRCPLPALAPHPTTPRPHNIRRRPRRSPTR